MFNILDAFPIVANDAIFDSIELFCSRVARQSGVT